MRKLIASTFVSLDGILQAPGGPDEDPTSGFSLGGWTFPYWDEHMDPSTAGFDGADRELVLAEGSTRSSRRTGRTSPRTTRRPGRSTPPASTSPRAR